MGKVIGIGNGIGIHKGSKLNPLLVERNTDIVEIGGWASVVASGSNMGLVSPGRYFLNKNNLVKIRQYGKIKSVMFYPNLTSIASELWIQIWRKAVIGYALVYEENVISKLTQTQINTIDLDVLVDVYEGDLISVGAKHVSDGILFIMTTTTTTKSLPYITGDKPINGFDWETGLYGNLTGLIAIKSFGQAPILITLGDSIMAGAPTHTTYVIDSQEDDHEVSIAHNLYELDNNYVYQNMAVGSKQSAWVAAAMATYVIPFKPKILLANGGVNDISVGTVTKEQFILNWTSILDICVLNSIIPVICKIIPWTNGDNSEMQIRDLWNLELENLVRSYPGAICIGFDEELGQYRIGGDAGNLWDIKPEYDCGDHVHLTPSGYAVMAEKINAEIKKRYRFE